MGTIRKVGIMGALPEEINDVTSLMFDYKEETLGMRTYYSGKINNIDTIVVFSRWGKVAAAATVATLILEYEITELIFTGVAGGIHPDLNNTKSHSLSSEQFLTQRMRNLILIFHYLSGISPVNIRHK